MPNLFGVPLTMLKLEKMMKPNTCLVVDVWEGQMEIDEAVLKANGVAGMGIRLNDMNGGHHLDSNFWNQWRQASNFVRFPYFVYNPWVDGPTNFAWLAVNAPVEAPAIAVDIEVRKSGYSAATYASEVAKFLTLCKSRWKMIVYTAQWFLPYLAYWPKIDYWWAQYPDSATYFSGVKTWEDLKIKLDRLDKPFNASAIPGTLKLWQFSGDFLILPGSPKMIDVNIFYGTEQDLADYFGTGTVVQPPQHAGLYTFSSANYYPRPKGGPLTLPLSRQRFLGDNMTSIPWLSLKQVLKMLNPTNSAASGLISSPDWGPSKGMDGDKIRWIALLWPGRNIVKIEEVVDNDPPGSGRWGRVEGIPLDKAPTLNTYDNPNLVHKVYDYNKANGWGERGNPVYVPILGGPWWVNMNMLVSVDSLLPKIVKIRAFPRLILRAGAGSDAAKIGYKYYGEGVMVEKVVIGKGGIWGAIAGGWIALRHNGTNWTDWKI